jgi:hypothetical protein
VCAHVRMRVSGSPLTSASCLLQGAITGSTLASTAATGANEVKYFNCTVNVSSVIPGVNVFACEMHQDSRSASDAYFDAELLARSPTNFVQPTPSRLVVGPSVVAVCRSPLLQFIK